MDLLTSWKTVPVRNYEEDDDLELNNTEISSEKSDFFSLKPEWIPNSLVTDLECETLVVSLSASSSALILSNVRLSSQALASITVKQLDYKKNLTKFNIFLYELDPDNENIKGTPLLFLDANKPIHLSQSFEISRLLSEKLQPKRVVIMDSFEEHDYISLQPRPQSPFVKYLATSLYKSTFKPPCSELEVPNAIKSVAASLLTHCETFNIPAIGIFVFQSGDPSNIELQTLTLLESVVFKLVELSNLKLVGDKDKYSKFIRVTELPISLYL
ncbi:proteasome assembly chaperone 1-like [Zophobas morio]|jgi:hypothetical protein|uniref:proteasome assembly chaperone 1-like n=1 Tax=Zophobas morio TaxID=2755281 RepID=UPI003083E916